MCGHGKPKLPTQRKKYPSLWLLITFCHKQDMHPSPLLPGNSTIATAASRSNESLWAQLPTVVELFTSETLWCCCCPLSASTTVSNVSSIPSTSSSAVIMKEIMLQALILLRC